ncbi:GNAT family N-acetyltransferase [Halomonas sp. ND22Bw]|uniref:GNAT family N-acetyltransferase n=1 Tax=Halomonas sp. ND22Bw TaxID=2054178 RepID=UPI000D0B3417|nr:GNAT family N-acetyltransferase [Halomonas sp. ND22Bw]
MPIRHARCHDREPLASLLDGYRVFYGRASAPDAARHFIGRRLEQGDSHLLVHEEDDATLTGFVQCYPLFSTVRLARQWRLNDLFVAPSARGRGVGRALMRAAAELARAEGVHHLALATGIDNRTAQALYESEGWRRDEAFHHYALTLG